MSLRRDVDPLNLNFPIFCGRQIPNWFEGARDDSTIILDKSDRWSIVFDTVAWLI